MVLQYKDISEKVAPFLMSSLVFADAKNVHLPLPSAPTPINAEIPSNSGHTLAEKST